MQDYQREFIDYMVRCEVLTFGDFVTKSGRKTPYFVNTGRYRTGAQIAQLGRFYAAAITARGVGYDMLFGPAYKGIPLVVAAATALHTDHGVDTPFGFDRKEVKDHGEGGSLVGYKPTDGDRVLIVEDVTTAGTSVRETVPKLTAAADVSISGLIVSVDRMERGKTDRGALAELTEEFGLDAFAIVTLDDIVEHLGPRLSAADLERIAAYRAEYGAKG
ncbi:MAG: orotate phosphoribosyltransferase [Proteobacteria bacterium]|nr:orotate phosphoribosyltransferase [Pseudomonadota bacterium]